MTPRKRKREREEVGAAEEKKMKRKRGSRAEKREGGQELTRSQEHVLHFERQQLYLVGASEVRDPPRLCKLSRD